MGGKKTGESIFLRWSGLNSDKKKLEFIKKTLKTVCKYLRNSFLPGIFCDSINNSLFFFFGNNKSYSNT